MIHYHDRGDDVILDSSTTAIYQADPDIRAETQALAQRNADETGRPCDVFADDGSTFLTRAKPQ